MEIFKNRRKLRLLASAFFLPILVATVFVLPLVHSHCHRHDSEEHYSVPQEAGFFFSESETEELDGKEHCPFCAFTATCHAYSQSAASAFKLLHSASGKSFRYTDNLFYTRFFNSNSSRAPPVFL